MHLPRSIRSTPRALPRSPARPPGLALLRPRLLRSLLAWVVVAPGAAIEAGILTADLTYQLLTPGVSEGGTIRLQFSISLPNDPDCTGGFPQDALSGRLLATYQHLETAVYDLGAATVTPAPTISQFLGFSASSGSFLTFEPSNPSGAPTISGVITIATLADAELEADERILLRVAANQTTVDCSELTFFVVDQQTTLLEVRILASEPPVVSVSGPQSVTEGDAGTQVVTFLVDAVPPPTTDISVDFAAVAGQNAPAQPGADFVPRTGKLQIGPNSQLPLPVTVEVIGDTIDEDDETFALELANPSAPAVLGTARALTTIVDDDEPAPAVRLSVADVSLAEGNTGTTEFTFTLSLAPALAPGALPVVVDWQTQDGSATAASGDYTAASGTVTMGPGASGAAINVAVHGDTQFESDEQFTLVLTLRSGQLAGFDPSATGTIRNDDQPLPVVRFAASAFAVPENVGAAQIRVQRVGSTSVETRVRAETRVAGSSATAGADYQPASVELVWRAGESGDRFFPVPVLDVLAFESQEAIALSRLDLRGATAGQPTAARLEIQDDDQQLELEAASATELFAAPGAEIEVAVVVTDQAGNGIAGQLVEFQHIEGGASFPNGATAISDANGNASVRLVLPQTFGRVLVIAVLVGQQRIVEFVFSVTALETLFPDPTSGEASVARALDTACPTSDLPLRELCRYLLSLPAEEARAALEQLTPNQAGALASLTLANTNHTLRTWSGRLAARRSGQRVQVGPIAVSHGRDALDLRQLAAALRAPRERAALERALERSLERLAGGGGPALAPEAAAKESDPNDPPGYSERWGLFTNLRYVVGDRDGSARERGYEFDSLGFTLGADYRVNDRWLVGTGIAYLDTASDIDRGGTLDAESYEGAFYVTYLRNRLYVDFVATYGRSDFELLRLIELPRAFPSNNPGIDGHSRFDVLGTPDGDQQAYLAALGYDLRTGALTINAFGRVSFARSTVDPFVEQVRGDDRGTAPFALALAQQRVDSLLAEAGFELLYTASYGWGVLQPNARASYLRELEDDTRLVRGSFLHDPQGTSFAVPTDPQDSSYFTLGVGLTATFPRGHNVFLSYDRDLERDDLGYEQLILGARLNF